MPRHYREQEHLLNKYNTMQLCSAHVIAGTNDVLFIIFINGIKIHPRPLIYHSDRLKWGHYNAHLPFPL
jgi:hypothetical protein